MGIIASIYTHPTYKGCSMNGISERFTEVTVVNAEGPFLPMPSRPAVLLESHMPGIVRAVPCSPEGVRYSGVWWMAGGAFISSSDSRFSRAVESLIGGRFYGAVALHDRNEGQ